MGNINILHLSDLHMCKSDINDIELIIDALLRDLEQFNKQGKKVDLVCFTGDLINRGDQSDEQLHLALDRFILPLLDSINLPEDRFLIIPGNHDVDRRKISKFNENALRVGLNSRDEINSFLDSLEENKSYLDRTEDIKNFIDQFIDSSDRVSDLTYIKNFKFDDSSIGIACFNSAWRCSADDDMRKLIIGEREVDKALRRIEGADIKIALAHHPLYWLVEEDERSVSPLFNKFHLVLNGHMHNLGESKLITLGYSTIFSSSGALYAGRSIYNGYNFIEVNPLVGKVRINLREFFDTPRRSFDAAISKYENGFVEHTFDTDDSSLGQAMELITNITTTFSENVNNLLVSNLVDIYAPKDLDSLFITPNLNSKSDYLKGSFQEKEDNTSINLHKVLATEDNLMFIGNKEVGKTTILHYIATHYFKNYTKNYRVPFLIDYNEFPHGKNPIEKAMIQFATEHFKSTNTPNLKTVVELLEKGRCVLLIDNLNLSNPKHVDRINSFMETYPKNRFIFTAPEDVFRTLAGNNTELIGDYQEIYIRTLSKAGVRELIKKWFVGRTIDENQLLDRIMYWCNNVGMPRTPFVISLILATCNQYENYIPINEANVMENFMQIVFEKLSIDNTKVSTYDFYSIEQFLAHVALEIAKNNNKWISLNNFYRFTLDYHDTKGLDLERSKFNELFFDKGILLKQDNKVYFRYQSIQEYYVAKSALFKPAILEWLLSDDNFQKHLNEIGFYTGMKRDDLGVLCFLEDKLIEKIETFNGNLNSLESYDLDQSLLPGTLIETKTLSNDEIDNITNLPDYSSENNINDDDEEIEQVKEGKEERSERSMLQILQIYGRAIRNSEDLELKDKKKHLRFCILNYITLLAKIKETLDEASKEIIKEVHDKEKEVKQFEALIKYILPFALQQILFESAGSGKLKTTLLKLIEEETNDYIKFMMVFLYSDLKLDDYLTRIKSLIPSVKNKDVLLLIKAKLFIYYGLQHITDSTSVSSMVTDIDIKIEKRNVLRDKILKSQKMKIIERELHAKFQ